MKYAVAIAALAAVARAQDACLASAAAVPPCALGYLASAASSINQCGLVDFQCQCSVSGSVQQAVAGTVAQQCGGASVAAVLQAASSLCACASMNSGQTASVALSQCLPSAAAIPPCALGYLASAGSAVGQCSLDDFACQCSNSAAIQNSIAGVVATACSDPGAVISSAGALCACVSSAGGGGSGGSGSAAPTGSGSSPSSGGSSAAMSGAMSGATTAKPSGSSGGSGSGSKTGVSVFTGAAATGAAFLPVGGAMGAMVGLLAYL